MTFAKHDLSGRVAIVTGGGTGIGAATAMLLAQRGADVMIAGRKLPPLEATAASVTAASGRRCLFLSADVTDPERAKAVIEETAGAFGRIDILVNNAGRATHSPLRLMPPEVWQKDVALNLNAAFYCAQTAHPYLKASGNGAIVNISSLAGVNGTMGVAAYSAAKSGLQMFTRVASAEWGPAIRVNAVACGKIATELAQANWARTAFDAAGASQSFPLRRPGRPDEIAEAVAFLASDAASYITGETLTVGGGPQLKGMIDTSE